MRRAIATALVLVVGLLPLWAALWEAGSLLRTRPADPCCCCDSFAPEADPE